eukprot:XP_016661111.1 PREDICTED: uncharacterized protein LOC107884123 [Acyrthosiphon pisum]
MTWSVIHFIEDNAVEVVPSTWFRDNTCAWPKTHVKRYIKNECIPNTREFEWFEARALSLNNESFFVAQTKCNKGLITSDVSSTEDDNSKIKKMEKKIKNKNNGKTSKSVNNCNNKKTGYGADNSGLDKP